MKRIKISRKVNEIMKNGGYREKKRNGKANGLEYYCE
jgi:hypothetical protein